MDVQSINKTLPGGVRRGVLYLKAELQCVYVELECAFEVARLVLVDDVVLGELVQHSGYLRKQCLRCALLGGVAQCLHSVACGLVIETVVGTLGSCLANSLLRRLVICHS